MLNIIIYNDISSMILFKNALLYNEIWVYEALHCINLQWNLLYDIMLKFINLQWYSLNHIILQCIILEWNLLNDVI